MMNFTNFFYAKKRNVFYSLLAIASTFFIIAAKYQPKSAQIVPAKYCAYKTVIFDLGDVLFETSKKAKSSMILSTILSNPTLLLHLMSIDIKESYFQLLETVPAKTTAQIYNKGKKMPQIMADFMAGRDSEEIHELVKKTIKESNHKRSVKNLMRAVAEFTFNPKKLANAHKPIAQMVGLAKELKKNGYKLYVLSNWDAKSSAILKEKHSELFNLFDGVMISGEEKLVKPQPEFYNHLIEKFNLNKNECIFIDDEAFNTKAAQTFGIRSIICTDNAAVCKDLIKAGIMTLEFEK